MNLSLFTVGRNNKTTNQTSPSNITINLHHLQCLVPNYRTPGTLDTLKGELEPP